MTSGRKISRATKIAADLAATLTAAVAFWTKTRSSAAAPT